MTDNDDPGNVIPIGPTDHQSKITRRSPSKCRHRGFEVDERALTVSCRDCGEDVDPIRVVVDMAIRWDAYEAAGERIEAEARRVAEELEDLKRQRANLRAQVKRLERKI